MLILPVHISETKVEISQHTAHRHAADAQLTLQGMVLHCPPIQAGFTDYDTYLAYVG